MNTNSYQSNAILADWNGGMSVPLGGMRVPLGGMSVPSRGFRTERKEKWV